MSSNVSSFAISSPGTIKNPEIVNYTISVINTEETISLPTGTKFFVIQNTGIRFVRLGYAVGDTTTKWIDLVPWCPHERSGISQTSVILYVRSPGLETLQIECWK